MIIEIPVFSLEEYKSYLKGEGEITYKKVPGWHTHHEGLSIIEGWYVIHTKSGLHLSEDLYPSWQAWFLAEHLSNLAIDWTQDLNEILEYRDEIKEEIELTMDFLRDYESSEKGGLT